MSKHQHIHRPRQRQDEHQSNNGVAILLLFLLLVVSVFAYTALRVGNDGGQPTTDGQCLSNGTQFNGRQEALTLAQLSEDHRTGHPFNGNYGYASYTLCYKNGTQQRIPSLLDWWEEWWLLEGLLVASPGGRCSLAAPRTTPCLLLYLTHLFIPITHTHQKRSMM